MKNKDFLSGFTRLLFLSAAFGLLVGSAFGLDSIFYGYGDAKLFLYYLLIFCFLFLVLSLFLFIYSKLRRIPLTFYNGIFLLCVSFVSLLVFYILSFSMKFLLQHKIKGVVSYNKWNILAILFISFLVTSLFFIWISSLHKRARGFLLAVLIASFIAPWVLIPLNERVFARKGISDAHETPNILLLTVESLRSDFLGINDEQMKTPALDALAKKGIVFENYFVQAPYTTVSITSLLTGQYPFHHKARLFGEKPDPQYRPFIEELAKKGYSVKLDNSFSSILFPETSRYNINVNDEYASLGKALYFGLIELPYIINDQLGDLFPALFGQYCMGNTTSHRQSSKILHHLRFNRHKKWFYWAHFIHNCHWPYGAPPSFVEMHKNNNKSLKTYFSRADIERLNENPQNITAEVLQGIKIAYSAEVSCIDRQIGIIVDYLKKIDLLEKTVIIVSADHGELLGETGFIGHGDYLRDALIHVPLVILYSGSGVLEGGKRVAPFVEEVDLAPTILSLCRIEEPPSYDGKSLLDILRFNRWQKSSVYSEVFRPRDKAFLTCYRTKEYKFLWDSTKDEVMLYNMISDPYEKENLVNQFSELAEQMKQQMLDFTGYASLSELKPDMREKIDEDMKDKLKALGYIKEEP